MLIRVHCKPPSPLILKSACVGYNTHREGYLSSKPFNSWVMQRQLLRQESNCGACLSRQTIGCQKQVRDNVSRLLVAAHVKHKPLSFGGGMGPLHGEKPEAALSTSIVCYSVPNERNM